MMSNEILLGKILVLSDPVALQALLAGAEVRTALDSAFQAIVDCQLWNWEFIRRRPDHVLGLAQVELGHKIQKRFAVGRAEMVNLLEVPRNACSWYGIMASCADDDAICRRVMKKLGWLESLHRLPGGH